MHLPDHVLDPTTTAATAVVAGAALAVALHRARTEALPAAGAALARGLAGPVPGAGGGRPTPGRRDRALLAAGAGAAVFAAQMLTVPLGPLGPEGVPVTAHLLGGAVLAALLGPWTALVTLTAVLALQAVVFADGGLLALGANVTLLAVVGVGVAHGVRTAARRLPAPAAVAVGALVAPVVAAGVALGLLAAGGAGDAAAVAGPLLAAHVVVGLGEAAVTAAVVAAARRAAGPAASPAPAASVRASAARSRLVRGALLGAPTLVLVALTPAAAGAPDALEAALAALGAEGGTTVVVPALADYGALAGVPVVAAALAGAVLAAVAVAGVLALAGGPGGRSARAARQAVSAR